MMERMNWVTRQAIKRSDAVAWPPKPAESISMVIEDQAPNKVRQEIVQELWATRGDGQTLTGFIQEIKAQEGLTDQR